MTFLLTDNLPLLAGAPNGIKELRELILELAVRGKLVPQDSNDEPAGELLKRIAEEKSRLVAEGKIKKQKSLPEVEEKPYALPLSWEWVRFDVISNTRLGKMLDKAKNKGELRPYLRNTNVQWFNFEIDDLKSMRFEEHELDEYRVNPGDLVICEGGEPGRCAVWQGEAEDMFIQKALHRARPWLGVSPFFLQFCLKAAAHSGFLDQFFTGATIKHFSGDKLAKYPVPLPPLAEQHRIVAKVDELMALCDRLEAQQADAESAHAQLVQALLDSLTQASDATDFAANWQRLADHFHTLFTTEPSIDALKQTLLQLGVMGQLVPNTHEHTISNHQTESEQYKHPGLEFKVPMHWSIKKLEQLSQSIVDCPHSTPKWTETGAICVRTSQFKAGRLDLSSSKYVSEDTYVERTQRLEPKENDILYSREGGILGIACRIPQGARLCLGQRMLLIRANSEVLPGFVEMTLNSPLITSIARNKTTGGAAPRVNVSVVKAYPIPLPPLAEQHRIVAKVDQLMVLCDQLKTRLAQARQLNEQLASTLVEQAVA